MKFAILSLLLAAAGMGTYGLRGEDACAAAPSDDACRVEVECTPAGTCLVTCYEADGSIRCQEELECDEPCSATQYGAPAQDGAPAGTRAPAQEPKAAGDCATPCAAPKSCARTR